MTELLSVENLRTSFHTHGGVIRAVDGVDFSIETGGALGVVGESGCGKTRHRALDPAADRSRRAAIESARRSCSTASDLAELSERRDARASAATRSR